MAQSIFKGALYVVAAFCCACGIGFSSGAAFAAEMEEVGRVLSLKPGVTAERTGQQVALEQKSPVSGTDVLHTDATGRAQILFADDSSVSLGSNTRLALEEVVAEGKNPVFKARLGQGMARFITGKIVERNPDGFAVVTPEATVGIRGTIFAVSTNDGKTTVYVMNTTRQVLVNGILVPGGHKITLPDGMPERMTPADMSRANEATAARNSRDQNADAPENGLNLADASGGNTVFNPDTLEQPRLGTELAGDSITPPTAPVAPTGPAFVMGTLNNTNLYAAPQRGVGAFSFTADLGSGAISGATMSNLHPLVGQNPDGSFGVTLPVSYTLSGGSGAISGNAFTVSNFSGPTDYRGMVSSFPDGVGSASMTGTASQGPSGLNVNGNYNILFPGGGYLDQGTFTGQQQ